MHTDLNQLRIDKSQKARRDEKSPLSLIVGGVAVVLLVAIVVWWWTSSGSAIAVTTQRVTLPTTTAERAEAKVLEATGYVMAAHKIELASKVVGRVAWVGVEMGDPITANQPLVRLEDDEYKARLAQEQGTLDAAKAKLAELLAGSRPQEIASAEARVDQAKADLATAERNFRRLKELETSLSVSKQELNDAETLVEARAASVRVQQQALELAKVGPRTEAIDAQKAVVRQLEGALSLAQVEFNNTVIRSTINGTVLERNVEVGEFVTTGFVGDRGAKGYVVSIADLSDLRVELDVSQNDFAKVAPGGTCKIVTDAYPDRNYDGLVDLISPEANRQKATVEVRVKVLNPDPYLKPDMNATVSFLALAAATRPATGEAAESPRPRIPVTAVRDGAVFVVEGGRAVKRPVTVGQKLANNQVEITTGLIGGEDLIVTPPATLTDGAAVKTE